MAWLNLAIVPGTLHDQPAFWGNVILVIANNRKYIHDAQDSYLLS